MPLATIQGEAIAIPAVSAQDHVIVVVLWGIGGWGLRV
jgi:hypothetical protein